MSASSKDNSALRVRGANWTEVEKSVLVEEVLKRESLLFGKFSGSGITSKDKEAGWAQVMQTVNSTSATKKTVDQCKKQFHNIKHRVKERHDDARNPKTGGGPRMFSPPPSKKLLWEGIGNRPGVKGISQPIDTEACTPADAAAVPDLDNDVSPRRKRRKTASSSVETDLIITERQRVEAETTKLHMETDLIMMRNTNERERHELEVQCLRMKLEILKKKSCFIDTQAALSDAIGLH
ncbi:uncharacterized protein [Argopecten irradians]|uniref:uncharacterized protein n=1 Tax=Argopecten irradians TaxID=31199 RepID=UPI00371782F4